MAAQGDKEGFAKEIDDWEKKACQCFSGPGPPALC